MLVKGNGRSWLLQANCHATWAATNHVTSHAAVAAATAPSLVLAKGVLIWCSCRWQQKEAHKAVVAADDECAMACCAARLCNVYSTALLHVMVCVVLTRPCGQRCLEPTAAA
jgi:hypothetical protein